MKKPTKELTTNGAAPDLSNLPVIDFAPMLTMQVSDDESLMVANGYCDLAEDYIDHLDTAFEELTAAANKIHKSFTGLRKTLTTPARSAREHCRAQIMEYRKRRNQEAAALGIPPLQDAPGERAERPLAWTYEWVDKEATFEAALREIHSGEKEPRVANLLCLDDKSLKELARIYTNNLERVVPGVRGVRPTTIAKPARSATVPLLEY